MKVSDVMTNDPTMCTPTTSLRDVARMMVDYDCGCIPVVEDLQNRKLIGVLTDRDIAARAVSEGRNPLELTARDIMSKQVVSTTSNADVQEVERLMSEHRIRRVPVVTANNAVTGMIAQADIARNANSRDAGSVVREVSRPSTDASKVDQDVRNR